MALDEPSENEKPVKVDEFEVLIGDEVKPYARGNILDWVKGFGGEGFIIRPESGSIC